MRHASDSATLTSFFQVITIRQSEAIIPDTKTRVDAINFLLRVGLFKMLKDNQDTVSFRAVAKNEINAYVVTLSVLPTSYDLYPRTKDLGGEESLVLGHIKAAGNEGMSLISLTLHVTLNYDRYLDQTPQGKDRPASNGH